jgi:hypothetical protein
LSESKTESNNETEAIAGETLLVLWAGLALAMVSLAYCFRHSLLLLYGDAVAHLYIARRIIDSRNPGFRQLGSVWLPLPHLLMSPFTQSMIWWRDGLAGAWISVPSYALACAGLYRLGRVWLSLPMALVAVAFFALNPGLLYMATTAMTEPLFLAEMIWGILLVVLLDRALAESSTGSGPKASPQKLLILAGIILAAAVFTRYDGWVLAAALWLFATLRLASSNRFWKALRRPWLVFTVLVAGAPAIWLLYNAAVFGDPLDFMRGPYSARAIEARTTPAGGFFHPGWHSVHVAALYFLKAAELGAISRRGANVLLLVALAGTASAIFFFRRKSIWPALLLWLPVPFYSYAIAYGSVPIFLPVWWPFSWYNTRYGMELLPAFALFGACLAAFLASFAPKLEPWLAALLLGLIVWNGTVLMHAGPLVYKEAVVNSRHRIAFEKSLRNALLELPQQALILMNTAQDVGALQDAGIPLRRTINEGDSLEWKRALNSPAMAAPVIIALDGDPVARAIQRHPQNLQTIKVICSIGEPCARIYWSNVYTPRLK